MASRWLGGKSGSSSEWAGFIDSGVSFEGKITVSGMFRIDGEVRGNIVAENGLLLGENAKVEGQIDAGEVTIAGRFDGQIFAKDRVEIQPKGVVTGEIHSPCLIIQPGGILDGQCHMLSSTSEGEQPIAIPIRPGVHA
ncbi:MAG: polymer-forming cytoskeletal protein [Candidatus Acidiferrales bacterium]